jgi:hypothetical protein
MSKYHSPDCLDHDHDGMCNCDDGGCGKCWACRGETRHKSGIRLMRGQVVIREIKPTSLLWLPDERPREVKTHRGVVLGMGPPARLVDRSGAPEVPWDFAAGDVVQFHISINQEAHTRPWVDGEPAMWLPQNAVDGVWE